MTEIKASNETMEKIQGFVEGAMQAVTTEMANEIAGKVVNMIELTDDVIQPETVDLLRKLPEVSKSLEKSLEELKKIEQDGTLQTFIQLSQMISSMKHAVTGPMITDLMEKAIYGVEFVDDLVQSGALELIEKMVNAFDEAKKDREGKEPLTAFQITRSLTDPQIREGISFLLSFAKAFANEKK